MSRKSDIPIEVKFLAINDYLNVKKSTSQICQELSINKETLRRWRLQYQGHGEQVLQTRSHNKFYSKEFKIEAVEDYINGNQSLQDIVVKYEISNSSVVFQGLQKYNGHVSMKSHNSTGGKIMTNGRKTTYEERVEIVSFCIANNENYQLTSEKYQVSYQQVYTWVKKYEESGPKALVDKRGKRKILGDMTETEKLAAQVKLLQAENERLQMENGFLKKLKEVDRRRTGKTNIQLIKNMPKRPDSQ